MGSVAAIGDLNILGATRVAMRDAMEMLAERAQSWSLPECASSGPLFEGSSVRIRVDGRPLKPFPYVHEGVVQGDAKSLAIAMASIVAKVVRDREMHRLAKLYPDYGFDAHKGYGTRAHREALLRYGPTPEHRALHHHGSVPFPHQ